MLLVWWSTFDTGSQRAKISVIETQYEELEQDKLKLGAIMLNSIKSKRSSKKKGLMFVDDRVEGTKVNALVYTVALVLFIMEGTAKKLGIVATKGSGWIKTVNFN